MDKPWNHLIEEINIKLAKGDTQYVIDMAYHLKRNLHVQRNADAWDYLNEIIFYQGLGIKYRKNPWE